MTIAVVGDIHLKWDDDDVRWFDQAGYEAILSLLICPAHPVSATAAKIASHLAVFPMIPLPEQETSDTATTSRLAIAAVEGRCPHGPGKKIVVRAAHTVVCARGRVN